MPTIFSSQQKKSSKGVAHPPHVHSSMGPFTTYAVRPQSVAFETQSEKEEIILFLRQHIIVLVVPVIVSIFLALAPTVLFPLLISFLPKLPFAVPVGYIIVGSIFWYLATFGFLLGSFLHWFFNIYIVTNERVVDIDFVNLLYKELSEANLGRIQDLSYTTAGLLGTVFNYGNVFIQTAAEVPNMEFLIVPFPSEVVKTISDLTQHHELDL